MFQQIVLFRNSSRGSEINEENREVYEEEAKNELAKLVVWDFDISLKKKDMRTGPDVDILRILRERIRAEIEEEAHIRLGLDPQVQDVRLCDYIRLNRTKPSPEERKYLMLVQEAQESQDYRVTSTESCRQFHAKCQEIFTKYEKVLPEEAYHFNNVSVYFHNHILLFPNNIFLR